MKKRIIALLTLVFMTVALLYPYPAFAAASPGEVGKSGANKNKSQADSCERFSDEELKVCNKGWDIQNAKNVGKKGATDKANKGDVCKFPAGSLRQKECQKAYDNQVIAISKQEGRDAGKSGAESPCSKLKWGVKAKQACTKEYKKAKKKYESEKKLHDCGGVDTYFAFDCGSGSSKDKAGNANPIFGLALSITGWITSLVAVAVVGGIVYGGLLYMTANDNSGQTKQAITIIINAVVALLLLMMTFAIINFIIPGGLFRQP